MSVRSLVRAPALRLLNRLALLRLRASPRPRDPVMRRFGAVVERTLSGRLDDAEREWVRRIEQLRGELLASDEVISLPDYGPGHRSVSDGPVESGYVPTRGVRHQCAVSKSPLGALLLFRLVREFQPARALELGTNLGISAAYQAAALALNGSGTLDTIEGAPDLARRSRAHLAGLGLGHARVHQGRFGDVLPALLAPTEPPLDYVFVDGHHDGPATLAYFDLIHPRLADGAVLVFDDIAWSSGMATAWAALLADPRIRVAMTLGAMGLCWVDRATGPAERRSLRVRT